MKATVHPSITGFAKQFAIPVRLAKEAFAASDNNYGKAYEWLRDYLLQARR